MEKRNFLILTIAVSFLVQGCVSASKHEKLEQDFNKTTAELNDAKAKAAACDNKVRESEIMIQDLQSKLGTTSSAKTKLESNVTEMKAALEAQTKQRTEAEQRIQEFRDFVKKFKGLTDAGQLTVKIVNGQMVVALSSDVLFSSGSARLSKAGTEAIQQVSKVLASVPERKFQVEGYTDNMPIKTAQFPSNWELASARALTVVKTMVDSGMQADRVSAASFGETHPVQANDSDTGRTANRRIEIVVVPDLSSLPGYDQLQKMSGP